MPALAAPDVYIFDEAMQSQAYNIGQEAIIKTLEGKTYQHGKVSEWTDRISDLCITYLRQASQGLKFCINVIISQQTKGGGLQSQIALRFDPATDGACVLQWENETMACCLTIFGVAM